LSVVCTLAVDEDKDFYDALSQPVGFTPEMDSDMYEGSSASLGYSFYTAAAADKTSSSVYLSVISQQTYLGCWTLNTELSKLLEVSLDQLQKSAPVKVICITSSCKLSKKSNYCLISAAVAMEMSFNDAQSPVLHLQHQNSLT